MAGAELERFHLEIAYARPSEQTVVTLEVSPGISVRAAIAQSGLLKRYPEIDLACNKVGIFGRLVSLDHEVRAGDRVEIYRPLEVDPKERRRRRASKPGYPERFGFDGFAMRATLPFLK